LIEFVDESSIQSNLRKVMMGEGDVIFTSHHVPDITTLAAVRSGRSDLLAFSALRDGKREKDREE
jgi:hypothetical protein